MDGDPECFGSIRLAAESPCHRCPVAARCARRFTRDNVFGVMVWPRLPSGLPQAAPGAPAALRVDPAVHQHVAAGLERLGLHYVKSRGVWKFDTKPVAAVREANVARVVVEMMDAPHGRVACMPSARGAQLTPVYPESAGGERVTVASVRARRERSTGCIITAADWRAAVALVGEVVRATAWRDA